MSAAASSTAGIIVPEAGRLCSTAALAGSTCLPEWICVITIWRALQGAPSMLRSVGSSTIAAGTTYALQLLLTGAPVHCTRVCCSGTRLGFLLFLGQGGACM